LLDIVGAMIAGADLPCTQAMRRFTAAQMPGDQATIIATAERASVIGAALTNACAANALDIDDGYRPAKGHPGAVIWPVVLALGESLDVDGETMLTAAAVGYEIAMRASEYWHSHPHRGPSYHGSGSWGSVGAAAAAAKLQQLSREQTAHAMGIAEYHAPIAPIMTCVEHPAMVKDGIHWGAFCGITAAQLAREGFTGIPCSLDDKIDGTWRVMRTYFKLFPCCRWAQPAVACILSLRDQHHITAADIKAVRIETFEAATHLVTRRPCNTEEAQYSLPFVAACAAVRGHVGVDEVAGSGLSDEAVLAVADNIIMQPADDLDARFPAEAMARVTLTLHDGRDISAGPLPAPGDADAPPSDEALRGKFRELVEPALGPHPTAELANLLARPAAITSVRQLTAMTVCPAKPIA
jgi:2-methylcitrate dehydratase PrpD